MHLHSEKLPIRPKNLMHACNIGRHLMLNTRTFCYILYANCYMMLDADLHSNMLYALYCLIYMFT